MYGGNTLTHVLIDSRSPKMWNILEVYSCLFTVPVLETREGCMVKEEDIKFEGIWLSQVAINYEF